MNLDELKDKLDGETLDKLKAHIDELTGQRDAAKKESIEGRKGLKAKVDSLESLKAKLFDKLGLETEEDIDNLPDAKGQAEAVKQFEAKVKRMERELADKEKALGDISAKHKGILRESAISKALAGQEFIHREAAELLIEKQVEWDGDEIFYKTEKGLVPLADGVKLFAEKNPTLLKNAGAPGSGHRQTGGTGTAAIKRAEFEALDASSRQKHLATGGTVTD